MSNLVDISHLHKNFQSDMEKQQFMEAQHKTIIELKRQVDEKDKELALLRSDTKVERFIVSPEEALIEEQISIIQNRSYGQELSLEDVKKLDILLKNKTLVKTQRDLKGSSKKSIITSEDLLKLVEKKDG